MVFSCGCQLPCNYVARKAEISNLYIGDRKYPQTYDFLCKVDAFCQQTVLLSSRSWRALLRILWASNLLGLEGRLVRLQDRVLVTGLVDVVYTEIVVVRSRQYLAVDGQGARGATLETLMTSGKPVRVNSTHSPEPLNVHSNLSKMQSFSYRSHSFCFKCS